MVTLSRPMIFLLVLIGFAVMLWLLLKWLGGYQRFGKVYHTVRSWILLLTILWVGCFVNTANFAFGIVGLAVLMAVKGLHEIGYLYRHHPSLSASHRWLDSVFVAVFGVFIATFIDLGQLLNQQQQLGVLVFVIFVIQFNDISQYLMGRWLGQRIVTCKLAPTLSPNKTIEGAVFGSLLTAIICLWIGKLLTPFSGWQIVGINILLTSLGIVGDLLESAVKRRHGVKDMGYWLKGHGGLMDRIDSLLLSVPVFWLIYRGWLQ